MDLNRLLIWFVCISCIVNLLRGLQHYRTAGGWAIISGLILGLTMVLSQHQPQTAGWLSCAVWGIFVVLPLVSLRQAQGLAAQYRFQAATHWATLGRLFHPFDGWWVYPKYLKALALAQSGRKEAIDYFHDLKNIPTPLGQSAQLNLFRIQGNWSGLRDWMEQDLTLEQVSRSPRRISFYLQALGETGAHNHMVEALERFQPALQKAGQADWELSRMIVLVYCGQVPIISRLLQGTAKSSRDRKFWLVTAYAAVGKPEAAQADLDDILATNDLLYCPTLHQRHTQPSPDRLSDRSRYLLLQWSQDIETSPRKRRPNHLMAAPITLLLIGLNVIVFMIELQQGGSENGYTLYRLGALVPKEVVAGAWWRLLAATFLHFGTMHLLFNMLGLAILGPFVERQLGWFRFSVMYFAAGIGSMLTVTIMALQGLSQTQFAVGASGAVMGVIGAEAAILLLQWRRKPTRLVGQRLQRVGLIVVLQTFFDLTTPQISVIGHTSGLILGFIVGFILQVRRQT